MSFDIYERFFIYLVDGYYDDLKASVDIYAERLTEYIKAGKDARAREYRLTLKLLKDTSDIIKDLDDENFEIQDFLRGFMERFGIIEEVET